MSVAGESTVTSPNPRRPIPPKPAVLKPAAAPIYVTKPTLPPRADLDRLLDGVYERAWLTNNGPLAAELVARFGAYFEAPHFHFVNNGTQALQLALRAHGVTGSVVTTPFTYVATANAIALEGCRPLFADVDADTLCLSPAAAEAAIRPDTTAIVPVHVYGRACDVDAFADIGRRRGVRVIYDAAHASGARLRGRALASYGDAAALSFHATKVLHAVEGGGVVTHDARAAELLDFLHAHGHVGDDYRYAATNAKNSEVHAAFGLLNLDGLPAALRERRRVYEVYQRALAGAPVRFFDPATAASLTYNYAYAPVRFDREATLLRVKARLEAAGVYPRRYFWPALTDMPQFEGPARCPVAREAARTSLCLPLYPELPTAEAERIGAIVAEAAGAEVASVAAPAVLTA